jgi:hypothetical protein
MAAYKEMSATDHEDRRARVEAWKAERPDANEPEPVAMFNPGAIVFVDGRYGGTLSDVGEVWPLAEKWIGRLLGFLPEKHRIEYWRERAERGEILLTLFLDTSAHNIVGAGTIECGTHEDSQVTLGRVMTLDPLDLSALSHACECVAVLTDTTVVALWSPKPVPVVPGYFSILNHEGHWQGVRVRPMQ